MVVDAFTWKSCRTQEPNSRPTFAFVRNWLTEEMRKAILQANYKIVQLVDIHVDVADSDIKWTKRSVVACMKEAFSLKSIQSRFIQEGIPVSLHPLGVFKPLINFSDVEEMKIESYSDIFTI
ncbi:Uncharacterized protein TCM_039637 [Theobroma cacao]|uniref:Uncharacterized protein n=1 Tax=Theobroma cacao TaxID=3641 RepID=A0A061GRU6_THECC|nr:Uncharacterized protein TCM_039637 [Theobroma cacao]